MRASGQIRAFGAGLLSLRSVVDTRHSQFFLLCLGMNSFAEKDDPVVKRAWNREYFAALLEMGETISS